MKNKPGDQKTRSPGTRRSVHFRALAPFSLSHQAVPPRGDCDSQSPAFPQGQMEATQNPLVELVEPFQLRGEDLLDEFSPLAAKFAAMAKRFQLQLVSLDRLSKQPSRSKWRSLWQVRSATFTGHGGGEKTRGVVLTNGSIFLPDSLPSCSSCASWSTVFCLGQLHTRWRFVLVSAAVCEDVANPSRLKIRSWDSRRLFHRTKLPSTSEMPLDW